MLLTLAPVNLVLGIHAFESSEHLIFLPSGRARLSWPGSRPSCPVVQALLMKWRLSVYNNISCAHRALGAPGPHG